MERGFYSGFFLIRKATDKMFLLKIMGHGGPIDTATVSQKRWPIRREVR